MARGRPQFVGYRSDMTFCQTQNHRGIAYPAIGIRRKMACRRLTCDSKRQKRTRAPKIKVFRSKSWRGLPIPIVYVPR